MQTAVLDISGRTRLPEATAEEEEDEWSWLISAGADLTGDGVFDALQVNETSIIALKGADGQVLWTLPTSGWAWAEPAGRLDGDAREDLLVTEFIEVYSEDGVGIRMRIRGISSTGTELWSRSYDERWQSVGAPGGYGYTAGAYADIDFAFPVAFTDLSGDGVRDVGMIRYSGAEAWGGPAGAGAASAVLDVVSGSNGQVTAQFAGVALGGVADAVVVPDLNGDGSADVVTASGTPSTGSNRVLRLMAFSGKQAGAPLWRSELTLPDGWLDLRGTELNGDGKGDVLVSSVTFPTTAVRAVSGADGSMVWSRSLAGFAWTMVAGDANGNGGTDLIAWTESFVGGTGGSGVSTATLQVPPLPGHEGADHEYYGPTCDQPPYGSGYYLNGCNQEALTLVDGKTGSQGWSYVGEAGFMSFPVGDVNGDAIEDVLFQGARLDRSRWYGVFVLISGKTGAKAWERKTPGYVWELWGDLNGDGRKDLVDIRETATGYTYMALSGLNAAHLWTQSVTGKRYLDGLEAAVIRSGKPADLLETRWDGGSKLAARDGRTRTAIWSR
ncbi:MAG TPA: VCBS repeat-containing protein [Actinomycetota bacterium]|nr:VCBS repeat-containing protein [Actinomycetota bacterium]